MLLVTLPIVRLKCTLHGYYPSESILVGIGCVQTGIIFMPGYAVKLHPNLDRSVSPLSEILSRGWIREICPVSENYFQQGRSTSQDPKIFVFNKKTGQF